MKRNFLAATALTLALSMPALAANPVQQNNSNAVWFENWIGMTSAMMRVASPDGTMTDVFSENGTPVFELSDPIDGVYRYELRAATEEMVKNRDYDEDSILGSDEEYLPKVYYTTGHFVVERGVIIRPEDMQEEGVEE